MSASAPGRIEPSWAYRPDISDHDRAAVLQADHPSLRGDNEQACYGRGGCWNRLQFIALRASARSDGDDVGVSQQRLAKLDEFFAREIASKRVPGAVVAIAKDGKLIDYKAYRQLDPAKGRSMRLDAMFALASMTKPMVAVAGLILMEQGRLPLQARLTDYYPEFANMKVGVPQHDGSLEFQTQRSPIYIHDPYRHTSGLTYGAAPDSSDQVARLYPDFASATKER